MWGAGLGQSWWTDQGFWKRNRRKGPCSLGQVFMAENSLLESGILRVKCVSCVCTRPGTSHRGRCTAGQTGAGPPVHPVLQLRSPCTLAWNGSVVLPEEMGASALPSRKQAWPGRAVWLGHPTCPPPSRAITCLLSRRPGLVVASEELPCACAQPSRAVHTGRRCDGCAQALFLGGPSMVC